MMKRLWYFHLLNGGLLAACFVSVFRVWNELPAKIPVHFGIDGTPDRYADKAEGLLIFLLAPVLLTLVLYGSAWFVPFARRWPSLLNVPRKEEFLRLPEAAQERYFLVIMEFMFLLTAIINTMFLFICQGTIAVAQGQATTLSGWAVWPGLALTIAACLVYVIRLVIMPGKLIDEHGSSTAD